MATSVSVSSLNSVPRFGFGFKPDPCSSRARVLLQTPLSSVKHGRLSLKRLNAAGLADIEPDLNEDPKDRWATNGVDPVSILCVFREPLSGFVMAEPDKYSRRFQLGLNFKN